MEFICRLAEVCGRRQVSVALMRSSVHQVPLTSGGELPATGQQDAGDPNEAGAYPTPGQVLWEIGCVIASCLCLGVLANLLFLRPGL
jgi:hypothetical protein